MIFKKMFGKENSESAPADGDEISGLLSKLRQAGQKPDRDLLDRVKAFGQAAVRPLIDMATDETLHDADSNSPEVWAPLHAIKLLGEIGAPEAIEPLLPLFDRVDDDWLAETLEEAFGGFGPAAVVPLRALLFDRTKDVWARVRAAGSLGKLGQNYPETRAEVVGALLTRLDPSESQNPDDDILNGSVVSALVHLKAVEAEPAIRQAFEEFRVDTSIIDLDYALEELGLLRPSAARRRAKKKGLPRRVRCTACGYEHEHDVELVYCDLGTMERHKKGKDKAYSEFVIPQRLTCPKCGAVDQYELTALAHISIMAEMLKKAAAKEQGLPEAALDEGPLQFITFQLTDGRQMHPFAAREMYGKMVEAEPGRADIRVRYANVLRWLGYREEATEQYQAALRLEPANLEAYLNLGLFARKAGQREEARRLFESVRAKAPSSGLSREDQETYVEAASQELAEMGISIKRSGTLQSASKRTQLLKPGKRESEAARVLHPVRAAPNVGRNEPCPCGSGKKYKKCHGRSA